MVDGSFERKSSNENKNAMENLQLAHDSGSLHSQKPVLGICCQCSRGAARLDGARGMKQLWRPHVRN